MASLNGRVHRLERSRPIVQHDDNCQVCGLPHIRLPIPVGMVSAMVRRRLEGHPVEVPRLCLCLPCCAEGQGIARLTHDTPPSTHAA
jgi:hypothetical protein